MLVWVENVPLVNGGIFLRRENYVNRYSKNSCHQSFSVFALKLLGFVSIDASRHAILRRHRADVQLGGSVVQLCWPRGDAWGFCCQCLGWVRWKEGAYSSPGELLSAMRGGLSPQGRCKRWFLDLGSEPEQAFSFCRWWSDPGEVCHWFQQTEDIAAFS